MRAIVYSQHGPALADLPMPKIGPADVRVRVQACALNRADLLMAEGLRHGDRGGPGTVLGMEWAGIVDAVGTEVPESVRIGQQVMGSGRGAFAEYAVADWGRVLPQPAGMRDPTHAAALPIALQTMHDALATHGQLRAGQSVLILGASTGVGLMAAQIARYMQAAWIGGTSTSSSKRARLREFGVDLALDTSVDGWEQQVLHATSDKGADVVIDMLSGAVFNGTLAATAIGGRIVNVGRLAGRVAEVDFNLHALRRVRYVGVTFRTRTAPEVRKITADMLRDLAEPLHAGKLRLPVDSEFSLEECAQALAAMRSNQHFGKIILRVA